MIIKFFAYVRDDDYAGCKVTEIPASEIPEPCDLRALGKYLSERYGETFRKFYFSPDGAELGEEVILLVNGRHIQFLNGIDTVLKDSDTVQVFPVVAGG